MLQVSNEIHSLIDFQTLDDYLTSLSGGFVEWLKLIGQSLNIANRKTITHTRCTLSYLPSL